MIKKRVFFPSLLLALIVGSAVTTFAKTPIVATTERADVTGYWLMYDMGAKESSGIAYVYEKDGIVYGRTLLTIDDKTGIRASYVNPVSKSEIIPEKPWLQGLDIIWGLKWSDDKDRYTAGQILDPRKKSPYKLDLWREGDTLKVYGKLGPFGASVNWKRIEMKDLPQDCPPVSGAITPVLYYPS